METGSPVFKEVVLMVLEYCPNANPFSLMDSGKSKSYVSREIGSNGIRGSWFTIICSISEGISKFLFVTS